ncbi:diguanylate cyclase [Shewanella sp. 10N.286.51.B7]|uniref:sensor domain-containing phosphodiesterase n=1 Tax=Shewanella sp. 10N.286.51.B7 TaxID=1880836 RepID=UPI000C85B7CC|nr:diguanylate cyclase [Shewanella sp. 10N.286.51.B7]PMG72302.1 diguanylate cyclase [Shewanella sp. 10N.286.51.B7]
MEKGRLPSNSCKNIEHLQRRVSRLRRLATKYKRAEIIQNALLEISNIATHVVSLDAFYQGVHNHLQSLIPADNFFIASINRETGNITLPFFADEKDSHPSELYPDEELSSLLERGITGYVLKTGEPLFCDAQRFDQLVSQGFIDDLGSACLQWLGVPIKHNNIVSGVLVVQSYSNDISYGELELELMGFICHHISGVMERLRHNEELEIAIVQRTKELSKAYDKVKLEVQERMKAEKLQKSLFQIADLSASDVSEADFYPKIHQVISQLLPAENCFISLVHKASQTLSFPFYVSQMSSEPPKPRAMQDGLTEFILKHKQPKLLSQQDIQDMIHAGEIYGTNPALNHTQTMKQWIGIPLFIHGEVAGGLTIYSLTDQNSYAARDLELLTFVSQHIANAIERKFAVEQLKRSHELLEDKVEKRTKAIAEMNDNLQRQIMQRKKMEAQLVYDAKHDNLTGLPNRSFFMERLTQAIKHIRRHPKEQFALLFIDLDGFKQINDTLGHLEGDRFLIETSTRLKLCIRENDTLARLGGDEFVILLDSIHQHKDAEDVCERILETISEPYTLAQQQVISGASIGVAFSCVASSDTSESILRNADTAMYQAKSKGKGCYVIFDRQTEYHFNQRIELEQDFLNAIEQNDIVVELTPVVSFDDKEIIAYEPISYWQHPSQGIIDNEQLTSLANQTQTMTMLDDYIFKYIDEHYQALANGLGDKIQIHMPLSSQHIKHKYGLRSLRNTIKRSKICASKLWVFFNEKAFVQDSTNHISAFESLSELGINIGINGYGTGYSSLSSLSFLPIKALKLDADISQHLVNDKQLQLAKAYQLIATTLGFKIFAEGVDTQKQKQILEELGYIQGQGQVFSLVNLVLTQHSEGVDIAELTQA